MPDYKRMYFELAAKVADAVELLIEAQQKGEESAMALESTTLPLRTEEDIKAP